MEVPDAERQAPGPPALVYPSDPRDGWEPGAPSIRAMAPSAVGGAIVPLAVYYLVRHQVGSDATALAIAGIPAAAWVLAQWARQRRLDPIGGIVLFGFIIGVSASLAMGGNAFVLKVRDSAFTFIFGLTCLLSVRFGPRPLMFYLGKALSAGSDPIKAKYYDDLWELAPAQVVFKLLTAMWGVGLVCDAATRILLAATLPTGLFLAVSPAVAGVYVASMFGFTVWFTRWTRTRAEAASESDIPDDGGSTWWWLKFYLKQAV